MFNIAYCKWFGMPWTNVRAYQWCIFDPNPAATFDYQSSEHCQTDNLKWLDKILSESIRKMLSHEIKEFFFYDRFLIRRPFKSRIFGKKIFFSMENQQNINIIQWISIWFVMLGVNSKFSICMWNLTFCALNKAQQNIHSVIPILNYLHHTNAHFITYVYFPWCQLEWFLKE